MRLSDLYRAVKTGYAPDIRTMGYARVLRNAVAAVKTLSGALPLTFAANGTALLDYKLYGNTVQSGTPAPDAPVEVVGCGDRTANLFGSAWEEGNINVVTGQNEVAGTMMRTKDYIPIKPNVAYSFSRNITSGFINFRLYRADKSYIGPGSASTIRLISGTSVENPMGSSTPFCCFEVIDSEAAYIRFNDSSNNTATKWLMVEGEYTQQTMPEYEPYGYKIHMVTRGKNLFDGWGVSKTFLGLTCKNSENMEIVLNGTKVDGANIQSITRPNIMLKAGTYTVSIRMISGYMEGVTDGVYFGINRSTYSQRTVPGVLKIGDIGKKTFTLTEDTMLSSFDIAPSYGSHGGIFTDATFECQFELGTEATPYEPYHEPVTTTIYLDKPLYKIGNYADSVDYSEGVVKRYIKELVLTGDEGILDMGNSVYSIRVEHTPRVMPLCSHYKGGAKSSWLDINNNEIITAGGSIVEYRVRDDNFVTLDAFKTYLAEQYNNGTPVKVYYVSGVPETESIDLPQIPTCNGMTTLDASTAVKPSSMEIKYR